MKPSLIQILSFDPAEGIGVAAPNYLTVIALPDSVILEGCPSDTKYRRNQRLKVQLFALETVSSGALLHSRCKVGKSGEAHTHNDQWRRYGFGGWRRTERVLTALAEGEIP